MSDNTFKVEAIPFDAIVKVDIGGGFHGRLHQLLRYFTTDDLKIAAERLKAIKENEGGDVDGTLTPEQYHLMTIMVLIAGIEEAAKEQGVVTVKQVTIPEDGSSPVVSPGS